MFKRHPRATDIESRLDTVGLRPFTDSEVQELSRRLAKTIEIGMTRQGEPTISDGGVLAAPTGVQMITPAQVKGVPDHTRGITAAAGGTNWIFAEMQKEPDGQVVIGRSGVRNLPEHERQHTCDSFVEIIADGLARIAEQCELTHEKALPVSVSLGFPQINLETEGGDIDARFPRRKLPKFWEITDYDESLPPQQQPSIAELLRQKLRARGVEGVGPIVIVNDTVAVALDVQHEGSEGSDAPVGFVFGTGTNGAMYGGPDKGLVNLEIGHAAVMDTDDVLRTMQQRGLVPDTRQVMEYWMGGGFIVSRVLAGIELLKEYMSSPEAVIKQIAHSQNQALISDMAAGRPSPLLGLSLLADDYVVAHMCAARALHQAAQTIGIHLATVCQAVNITQGPAFIPYEGSVLGKGFQVKERALQTVKTLLPALALKPYEASGLVGVGKLAMVRLFQSPTKGGE